MTTMTMATTMIRATMMVMATMMTMAPMRKLEVVHKQVGGYLTRCAHIAASIALN